MCTRLPCRLGIAAVGFGTILCGVVTATADSAQERSTPSKPIACTVQADSVLGDRYRPAKLFDGNREAPTSRWASARTPAPHWVVIELEAPVVMDRVVAHGHDDRKGVALADAAIQVRHGDAWKTAASVKDNEKAAVEFTFEATRASAIRLWITRPCRADQTARLFEIVLYRGEEQIPLKVRDLTAGASEAGAPVARVDDARLLSTVVPLAPDLFRAKRHGQRNQRLLQQYYDSMLAWSRFLGERFQPVPGHPGWGYYGAGDHRENTVRPICYAALANAFLAEIEPPGGGPDRAGRDRMRGEAIATIGYLTHAHQANGGACLDGHPWGNQWQSAMWARALGMAGWLLWERLDRPARLAVARVVEYEADRFIYKQPKSRLKDDTGAEENAWNAGLIALARCMMPEHPRANEWDQAAKRYMYNTFSVAADASDESIGDDGRPVREWVTTVNAHPDFTVENHGLVHVGYLKTSHAMLLEAASPYVMTGRPVPRACLHHMDGVFDVLLKCVAWEGAPIHFGGNDWKLVHTQCSDVINFALTNVLLSDARAAYAEQVALDWLCRIQQRLGGRYTVRKDLEHNGLCASRLVVCYLIHAQAGEGVRPVSEGEFDASITGVTHLEHGQAILHRTPGKFASFAWGSKRMALAMPRGGNWVVWPHFASYLGLVNGKDGSRRNAALVDLDYQLQPNRFTATGTLKRLEGQVEQDFSLASLESDVVVYIERLRVKDGFRMTSRETGIVGHEYPLDSNTRTLFGRFGRKEVVGLSDREAVHELETDWLNIGGHVGYVVRRSGGHRNLMRYHDQTEGTGRVPKLQEWLSLVGEADPASHAGGDDWACVVTFLNQSPEATAEWAERVRFEVDGDVATCRLGEDTVQADFAQMETRSFRSKRQSTGGS